MQGSSARAAVPTHEQAMRMPLCRLQQQPRLQRAGNTLLPHQQAPHACMHVPRVCRHWVCERVARAPHPELHGAQHGQERLADHKGLQHVGHCVDGRASCARLPAQDTPHGAQDTAGHGTAGQGQRAAAGWQPRGMTDVAITGVQDTAAYGASCSTGACCQQAARQPAARMQAVRQAVTWCAACVHAAGWRARNNTCWQQALITQLLRRPFNACHSKTVSLR